MIRRAHLLLFALLLFVLPSADAQFEVGSITGAVTDASGARLPA